MSTVNVRVDERASNRAGCRISLCTVWMTCLTEALSCKARGVGFISSPARMNKGSSSKIRRRRSAELMAG